MKRESTAFAIADLYTWKVFRIIWSLMNTIPVPGSDMILGAFSSVWLKQHLNLGCTAVT